MNKKLSIIGSVGVPANYGGFETLAEYLTKYLSDKITTTVYCSGKQYKGEKQKVYNNAKLVYIPLDANGIQSILYDVLSILHALFISDVLLVLGVAGSFMFPFVRVFKRKQIIVNIDGLEHKREKWSPLAKRYLKLSEAIAVKYAHVVIADNQAIQEYVMDTYNKQSVVIPYGGDHFVKEELSIETKQKYNLPEQYAFKVCRIEPENNIHIILEAFSDSEHNLVIIGNWQNSVYGQTLFKKYNTGNIILLNPIYDQKVLNEIRSNCSTYIHGHSAGGTNPSLVEAMFLGRPIYAFDVKYNRYTTNGHALFFKNSNDLVYLLNNSRPNSILSDKAKIHAEQNYKWESVINLYQTVMKFGKK